MSLTTLLIGSALLTAAVVSGLAFTRWGRRRPLHRYGALSIAAHLMLLAGLASVRTGGPPQMGAEDAPPIRVQLVMRTTSPQEPEPKEPKEVVEPKAEETEETPPVEVEPAAEPESEEEAHQEEPPVEESTPAVSNPDQAWSGLVEVEEVAPPEVAPPEVAPPEDVPLKDIQAEQASLPKPVERVVQPIPQEAAPIRPIAPATSPLAPSAYNQRGQLTQRRLSDDQGGNRETLDAVASAIDWLARAQRRDGAWDAVSWQGGRETKTHGHNRRGAGAHAETGLTGLALLAIGGNGHTHLDGPYRETVTAGLQFLLDQQADNGDLAGEATMYARTYCHSMATFALAEAMAVTDDQRLLPAVSAATRYLIRSQNLAGGGWRYNPGDRGDMSQMGWAVMALRSAELAGIRIDPRTWNGCERFVTSVRRGQHGGLAAYQPHAPVSSTMTAEAMYCRQILGISNPQGMADAEAISSLLAERPGAKTRGHQATNLYYWYYATLALHHHRSSGPAAETAWDRWNTSLQRSLLPKQVAKGRLAGSWDPDTLWGGYGGRVYSTALATMCLEVYYRYDPEKIGRDPWIAAREMPLRR